MSKSLKAMRHENEILSSSIKHRDSRIKWLEEELLRVKTKVNEAVGRATVGLHVINKEMLYKGVAEALKSIK